MADQEGLESRTIDQLLDSTLESVDVAEEAVLKEAQELGFGEDDLHEIGMAVRECMVNAVVHGNRYNARKKVRLSLSLTPERLTIRIADEGLTRTPGTASFDDVKVGDELPAHHARLTRGDLVN